ncbi:MAG: hypothetical protein FWD98_08875, partial [Defluviitaleaceae bacterium]|nr:hypothetical protein [Defluviitaleaceae bacterium]
MKKLLDSSRFGNWLSLLPLIASVIVMYMVATQIGLIWGWLVFFLGAVSPFVSGFVIAYVLNMPRGGIERLLDKFLYGSRGGHITPYLRARKFGISVLLTYLSLLFIVILVTNIVTPRIYQSIMEFVEF